jgi:hypothetical protein
LRKWNTTMSFSTRAAEARAVVDMV